MRFGIKFAVTVIIIVVVLSVFLELASLLVFSTALHSLNKKLFYEQADRLSLLAYEQDELFFEGYYNDEDSAKLRVLDKIRIMYRKEKDSDVFPFAVDSSGKVIIHPDSGAHSSIFSQKELAFIKAHKQGEIEYLCPGHKARLWCVFKTYEPWGWVFCVTTPVLNKNRPFIAFIGTATAISLAFIFLSAFAILFISKKFINPIHAVIQKVQLIASGENGLAHEDKGIINADDEIGLLASAVGTMAANLKKTTVSRDELVKEVEERKSAEAELKVAYDKLKFAQQQLVQSSKLAAVGQLAGGVAHEINNPLTGVLNNVQLIKMMAEQKSDFKMEEFKELIDIIEESALRCKNITKLLLESSRASGGAFSKVSVNEIVQKASSLIAQEMNLQNIHLELQLAPDLPKIKGDFQLLQQVVFDLISNAKWAIQSKSLQQAGTITLKTAYDAAGRNVLLDISDDGIGIAPGDLKRLFEPFFTTKPVGEGTGLGLAIAHNIIRDHKGSIAVESKAGQGTTFKISLPVLENGAA